MFRGVFYNVGQIWHKLLLLILHVEIVDCFVLVFHIENSTFFVDRKLLSWHSEKQTVSMYDVFFITVRLHFVDSGMRMTFCFFVQKSAVA